MTFNKELIFIEHILDIIRDINRSLSGINKEKFTENIDTRDANIRRLEIIGEAVKNLSEDFRKQHSEIEWRKIAGFRDVIIHKYFEVDLDVVWSIIKNDLPVLKSKLEKIKKNTKEF